MSKSWNRKVVWTAESIHTTRRVEELRIVEVHVVIVDIDAFATASWADMGAVNL